MKKLLTAAFGLTIALALSACDHLQTAAQYSEGLAIEAQQELDKRVPREFRCAVATAGVATLDEDDSLLRVLAWTGAQRAACEGLDETVNACDVYAHVLTHAQEDIPDEYMGLVREAYFLRCGPNDE